MDMSIIGNIFWLILGGIVVAVWYLLGGILLCLTIIGIPFGLQCFKLASFSLTPFGREIVNENKSTDALSVIMNLLWLLFCGLGIATTHLFFALICAITIVGIPLASQHIKLISIAIAPFGRKVVKK